MVKNWLIPLFWMFVKTLVLLGLLVGIWVGSGVYHSKEYRRDADEVVRIRVRAECLRPDYVRTDLQAREYDVSTREMDLVASKLDYMDRKASDLLEHVGRVEAMRYEFTQGKISATGGMGGPAPKK